MITHFTCDRCSAVSLKWAMKCGACGAWKSLVEMREAVAGKNSFSHSSSRLRGPVALGSIKTSTISRLSLGCEPFDRVLGGGAVLGGATLIGGEPGIGKSTLLMQALSAVANAGERALYVSGEESEEQIASHGERLEASPDVLLFAEMDVDTILEVVEHMRPACLVIDSVQTVRAVAIEGVAGSLVQVRHATSLFVEQAKRIKCALLLVCHVTKDGAFAGPKTLEHLVDTVVSLEMGTGDRRLLSCSKNRFGSTSEVGLLEMTESGLRGVVLVS